MSDGSDGDSNAGIPSIRRLDETVVNRIAAGEVLHRPANAIKEMIENSVDAGATMIQVMAKDGGLKLLQIVDNGHGIKKSDLAIVCERFTTSKLDRYEDLSSITTFGFRGEALASISHVAHVSIITRTSSEPCAYRAMYKDGKLVAPRPGESVDPRPCAGNVGTQITVEDLFYNVATRRKALKSFSDEYSRILDVVSRYAVHYPNISFSCKKHGSNTADLSTTAGSTCLDAIRVIHGASVARELLDVSHSNDALEMSMHALVSNANYSPKKGAFLLFINHRAVESANLKRALEVMYTTFLPKGTHPFLYISLQLAPASVDVNVHPTKREVHFLHEDEIIDAVVQAVHERLLAANTSRTFLTQTLLPGASAAAAAAAAATIAPPPTEQRDRPQQMIRTDSRARTLDSFVVPTASSSKRSSSDNSRVDTDNDADVGGRSSPPPSQPKRARHEVRLSSVLELREAVSADAHSGLSDIFREHAFVGCIDARLALVQHHTRLLVVNYHELSRHFFYQRALSEFSNFGRISLSHPPTLAELLRAAVDSPEAAWSEADGPKEEIVSAVVRLLVARRDMLLEYFALDIVVPQEAGEDDYEEARLRALPLMLPGYLPNLERLPMLLLRLGAEVKWDEEKECLDGIARELGLAYAAWPASEAAPDEDAHYKWIVEHVLFPGMRKAFQPPRSAAASGDVLQIASLPDLYKIFERC